MANTVIQQLMDRILARVLLHQRNRVVLPALVNRDFSTELARKGNTIDVRVPRSLATYNIVPGATRTVGNDDSSPATVPIVIDQWKGNGFHLTDKEITQISDSADWIPMETTEAANALVDDINASIADTYVDIYGIVGTPGQTPFQRAANPSADHEDAFILAVANKVLNDQKAPSEPRHLVMNTAAQTNALKLDAFRHADKLGDNSVGRRAVLGLLGGFENRWQHYIPLHAAGTLTANVTVTGVNALGVKTVNLSTDATGVFNAVVGDIITFAGDSQTYVVTAVVNIGNSSSGNVSIEPGLQVATAGGEAVAMKASHRVNLAFHPMAFGLVMRQPQDFRPGGIQTDLPSRTMADPMTGLVLRLEILREHKQWYFELDALWGTKCVFPWLACRAAGESS